MSMHVVTKAEFAHLSKVSRGRVSQWIREGKIPPAALVGEGRTARVDVQAAQAALKGSLDPAQRVPGSNGDRTQLSRSIETIPSDPVPDPAAYRSRADLPDDFARGALFGAHAVAYGVPHGAALIAAEAGVDHPGQVAAYRDERDVVFLLVQNATIALGLEADAIEEPSVLSPTAFLGFGPGGSTGGR